MSSKPTKQWAKQAKSFASDRRNFVDNFVKPEDKKAFDSPLVKDRMRRIQNSNTRSDANKENMTKRGNPLSIVANEGKPNPARRIKLLKAAKANSTSSKGL
tara:strand:- start:148 stop:450 length:303 start_codon:yes stop_codon:yes gene_type:complete